jgi:hypothetical protein
MADPGDDVAESANERSGSSALGLPRRVRELALSHALRDRSKVSGEPGGSGGSNSERAIDLVERFASVGITKPFVINGDSTPPTSLLGDMMQAGLAGDATPTNLFEPGTESTVLAGGTPILVVEPAPQTPPPLRRRKRRRKRKLTASEVIAQADQLIQEIQAGGLKQFAQLVRLSRLRCLRRVRQPSTRFGWTGG